jgi:hypothetical protein
VERPSRRTGVSYPYPTSRHSQGFHHVALSYRRARYVHHLTGRASPMAGPVWWAKTLPRIEAYIARLLSKEAYNSAALEGQQRMKKGTTRAAKCTRTKASATMVTADQLDCELADARPPSPPPDPATAAAWHQDNGLAVPDHLTVEAGLRRLCTLTSTWRTLRT